MIKKIFVLILVLSMCAGGVLAVDTPAGEAAVPAAPADKTPPVITSISSATHPEQTKWYNGASIGITWEATDAQGITGYLYEFDTMPATTKLTKTLADKAFSAQDPKDGVYYFHVQAVDAAGNKSKVAHFKVQVDRTAPSAMTGLKAYTGKDKKNTLTSAVLQNATDLPYFTWTKSTDAGSGLAYYKIYWGDSESSAAPENVTATVFVPGAKAQSSKPYYLRGSAVDKAGNATPIEQLFVFEYDGSAPAKVVLGRAAAKPSENRVVINWERSGDEDIVGYDVYRKQVGARPVAGVKLDYVKVNKALLGPETISYTDDTVKRGEQYLYAVKARDKAGNLSELSKEVGVPLLRVQDRTQKVTHEWDAGDAPVPGATITYTLEFANDGYTAAHNVAFEDAIPENTTYEYHSADCSLPTTIYYWVKSLNDGAGGWTDKEPKKTADITKIKWVLKDPLPPVKKLNELGGSIRYSVKINYI